MSIVIAIFTSGIILNVISQTEALKELPKVEDNDILKAGVQIRDTTNNLFSALKFQGKKNNPNLVRLVLIHSYLVTLTSKDYTSLTEVAKLTRVVKRNDFNVSANFIEILNEIVDSNANGEEILEKDDDDANVYSYINNYMQNLAYINYLYSTRNPTLDINNEMMQYFEDKVTDLQKTKSSNSTIEAESDELMEGLDIWKPEPETRRIYQGKRSKIKHFPFMASVEIFGKFTCGGSIIHDDLVLTAASCLQLAWNNRFYRENPAFLSVRIGSTFIESGGEKVEILEVYFHPSYNPGTLHHNLAMMRLIRKIRFTKKNRKRVMKIEFDKHDHRLPSNTEPITVVGWGAKTATNVIHNAWEQQLSYDTLGVYGLEDCQDIYSKKYVTTRHFCAGYISKGGGACNRDVGSPGVVDGILTGVISFGSPVCGAVDSPTVFTKVGYYVDWIEEIMEQPVQTANHRTTTFKPDFDYGIPWQHTTPLEAMPTPIFSTKPNPASDELIEVTTIKGQLLEMEIKTLIGRILRKEKEGKKKDSFDSDNENILKTNKKTTISALENKIMEIIRASRMAEAATEVIPKYTVINDSVDPTVFLESSDDDEDSVEHPKKVTVQDITLIRTENHTQELKVSEDKIQPISSTQPKLSETKKEPMFVQDMTREGISQNSNLTTNPKNYRPDDQRTIFNLQHDLELIKMFENSGKANKQQIKRFKKPANNLAYDKHEKMKPLTTSTKPLRLKKIESSKYDNPVRTKELEPTKNERPVRPENFKPSKSEKPFTPEELEISKNEEKLTLEKLEPSKNETPLRPEILESSKHEKPLKAKLDPSETEKSIGAETFKPSQSENSLQSDVLLSLLYDSENEKAYISPKLTRNSDSDDNNEVKQKWAREPTLGKTVKESDTSSVSSDSGSDSVAETEKLSKPDDNNKMLANYIKKSKFPNNKNQYTFKDSSDQKKMSALQNLLSDKDLYEILSEALRENLNLNIPGPTTSLPEHRRKTRKS